MTFKTTEISVFAGGYHRTHLWRERHKVSLLLTLVVLWHTFLPSMGL